MASMHSPRPITKADTHTSPRSCIPLISSSPFPSNHTLKPPHPNHKLHSPCHYAYAFAFKKQLTFKYPTFPAQNHVVDIVAYDVHILIEQHVRVE
ncbi:uncharacterized protein SETTUDRAFT_175956 [Exserohilum turcica Et28A]|uniref:Uncharacterized protein n=1 Tax=Exserohilum turcicum (strain 28A) TaxID=671987 RepID=R0KJ75_EXST2|nr:uncharacterized protein SETTUDRAFT_175956 [Exserohilum turcica Et28A]EOA89214.1 hypothetical protein SETTUDRAFT_175956 [Exserohilum turcica Et28A]